MSYWSQTVSPSSPDPPPRHLLAVERDKAAKAAKERGEPFDDSKNTDPEIQRMNDNTGETHENT